jgi:hypothetical protein
MRKKLDNHFLDALNKAISDLGGQSELARRTGVGQSTINSIVNPKKGRLFATEAVFDKLMVVIKQYMSPETINNYGNIATATSGTAVVATGSRNSFFAPTASSAGNVDPELVKVAMVGMSPEEKARFLKELSK